MTSQLYYIDIDGMKDGPHDLVTIMRRIRTGKITPTVLIYIGDAAVSVPAAQIEEIALFFVHQQTAEIVTPVPSLRALLTTGWHFTHEHNIMTVFAGGLLLVSLLFATWLVGQLGLLRGGIFSWMVFVLLHNIYLIFVLRLHRGQTFSPDFINKQLTPVLPPLIAACVALSLMMAGGVLLLIVPCLIVSVLYIFVPFLMLDHRFGIVEAMTASRLLLQKHRWRYVSIVTLLVALHLVCLALIIPIPLTLPVFAAALAELYEEVSAS